MSAEWNGEDLPPVGCECEYSLNAGMSWFPCKIEYVVGTQGVVMSCDVYEGVQYVQVDVYTDRLFRPIRTEAERKHDEAVAALKQVAPQLVGYTAANLYDAIAAGKIPHITLK